jgi:hypothetical protein
MNFMDLFVPMTAAFVAASLVVEALHALLGFWLTKRHQARAKEYYKEVAEKMGMTPEDLMSQMENQMSGMGGMGMMEGGPPGMMGGPMGSVMTTTSGGGDRPNGHGQYL